MLASHAVGSWSFSREWRFCIFQRLWLVLCWFTVFLRVLHLEWCAGLQVCNCVSVCVCICRLWWWRSCSDQLLLSNQPPAVSSPPASSTCWQICKCRTVRTRGSVYTPKTQNIYCMVFVLYFRASDTWKESILVYSYPKVRDWFTKPLSTNNKCYTKTANRHRSGHCEYHWGQGDCTPIRKPSSFNLDHMLRAKLGLYKVTVAPIRCGVRMELYHSAGSEG